MWDRKLLKQNGKAAFKRHYWWAVLWAIVFTLLVTVGLGNNGDSSAETGLWEMGLSSSMIIWLSALAGSIGLLVFVARIVVGGPFRVGYSRWLLKSAEGTPEPADVGYFFRSGQLGRTIAGIFCTDLIIGLWTLLFIIPGVVASYKYRLVPYLMAENEWMTGKEARQRSAELMSGYKGEAFVLDLSFIGWFLLDVLTLGILGIFYVNPYVYATHCEFYRALRDTSGAGSWQAQDQGGWQAPGAQQGTWNPQDQGGWQAPGAQQGTWNRQNPQDQGGWQAYGAAQNAQGQEPRQTPAQQPDAWNAQNTQEAPDDGAAVNPPVLIAGAYAADTAAEADAAETAEQNPADSTAPSEEAPADAQEPEVHICPSCGNRIVGPAHFCNMCGTKL